MANGNGYGNGQFFQRILLIAIAAAVGFNVWLTEQQIQAVGRLANQMATQAARLEAVAERSEKNEFKLDAVSGKLSDLSQDVRGYHGHNGG